MDVIRRTDFIVVVLFINTCVWNILHEKKISLYFLLLPLNTDFQLKRLPDNMVETPLGNISEVCYNDTVQMVDAVEKGLEWGLRSRYL